MRNFGSVGTAKDILKLALIGIFSQFLLCNAGFAQDEERDVIQFTGVVTDIDTISGIMGAHVYVPKGGRG